MHKAAEVTYSSRVSQLLAARARGVQTDVFTLTSLLAGVFTLGETGREESTCDRPSGSKGSLPGAPPGCSFHGKENMVTVSENKAAWPPLTCGTGNKCCTFSKDVKGHSTVLGRHNPPHSAIVGTAGSPARWGKLWRERGSYQDDSTCWSRFPLPAFALPHLLAPVLVPRGGSAVH